MAENAETETPYAKGEKFEILFAKFMKSDLGWEKYIVRSQQKSGRNSKGSQVDIIGQRKDDRYRRLWNLGVIFSGILAVAILIGIIELIDTGSDTGFIIIGMGLIPGATGIYCFWDCEHYHKENAWVECKNRKEKSTYDDVRKSVEEFNGYKASGDKEYKYIVHYFVSANGFKDTALKHAHDNGIICYTYKNGKFEIEPYWK